MTVIFSNITLNRLSVVLIPAWTIVFQITGRMKVNKAIFANYRNLPLVYGVPPSGINPTDFKHAESLPCSTLIRDENPTL